MILPEPFAPTPPLQEPPHIRGALLPGASLTAMHFRIDLLLFLFKPAMHPPLALPHLLAASALLQCLSPACNAESEPPQQNWLLACRSQIRHHVGCGWIQACAGVGPARRQVARKTQVKFVIPILLSCLHMVRREGNSMSWRQRPTISDYIREDQRFVTTSGISRNA